MTKQLVTCPETGHLEEIALERTPQGIVILRCSRFSPTCNPDCPRECARRMDRRERVAELSPEPERVLVIIASTNAETAAAASALANQLRADGLVVDVADADNAPPPPQDYDAVVIGGGGRYGRRVRDTVAYLNIHHDALAAMPTFFFGTDSLQANATFARLVRVTGWRPNARAIVDGVQGDDLRWLAVRLADEIPARATA